MAKTKEEMEELKERIKRGMEGHEMPKKGAERLFTLAALIRTVPPKRLDMNHYINSDDPVVLDDPECGTAACALGWCTVQWPREFKQFTDRPRFGMTFKGADIGYDSSSVGEFFGLPCVSEASGFTYIPYEVANSLFGADDEDSNRRTPKQEAELLEYAAQCCGWYPVQEEN